MNFRKKKGIIMLSLVTMCMISACKKRGSETGGDVKIPPVEQPKEPTVLQITPIGDLNEGLAEINSHADMILRSSLKMDLRSFIGLGKTELGVDNPRYPRIKKMANGSYIIFYHNSPSTVGASCDYAISNDLKKWTPKGKIFESFPITDSGGAANRRAFSTCDALVLSNGDILAVASYRAENRYTQLTKDAGVVIRRSKDNGNTWSGPIEIYQGVNWEPYLLQLPSGEIHCYFTDSNRTFLQSNDTGTAMVSSNDGGITWTPSFGSTPYYVLRTEHTVDGKKYFNNQMPSVIKLNNSNELAAAMEANIGGYHISFAYSGESGQWPYLKVDQQGPADRNDLDFLGSAPYLRQFKSGETILSYNQASRFRLKLGDAKARNFGDDYLPPFFTGGYWGSLELEDNHQIIGVMPNTGEKEISLAKFILNHRIKATQRAVATDGNNNEWLKTDEALFVGENSQAQATLRASQDNNNLYFLIEVLDESISTADFVTLFLCPTTNNTLGSGAYKMKLSYSGIKESHVYNGGWVNGNLDATIKTAYRGTPSQNSDKDHGYIIEIAIPRSKLNIQSGQLLVNFSIAENGQGEDSIASAATTSTLKWIPVVGL